MHYGQNEAFCEEEVPNQLVKACDKFAICAVITSKHFDNTLAIDPAKPSTV